MLLIAVFLLRPNTVWGFEPGDVRLLRRQRVIAITVRLCKRWPELRLCPAQREVQCGGHRTPLGIVFDVMCRAEDDDPLWYRVLRDASSAAGGAAAKVTGWLQDRCDTHRVPRQDGRKFTAYSLRIAIASTMWAYGMDERWIQSWGYWRTHDQYFTYVRKWFGRHPFIAGLITFGFALQEGRPFDFVARPRDADSQGRSAGLRGARNNSAAAVVELQLDGGGGGRTALRLR